MSGIKRVERRRFPEANNTVHSTSELQQQATEGSNTVWQSKPTQCIGDLGAPHVPESTRALFSALHCLYSNADVCITFLVHYTEDHKPRIMLFYFRPVSLNWRLRVALSALIWYLENPIENHAKCFIIWNPALVVMWRQMILLEDLSPGSVKKNPKGVHNQMHFSWPHCFSRLW